MEESRVCSFQSCCRLCLCESVDSLRSIFDEGLEDRALPQKISQWLAIEISINDKLSKMICEQCLSKVISWNSFKDQCEQNQSKLQEWLTNNYQNAPPNGLANMTLQIKEEPADDQEESEEHEIRTESLLQVKREPVESNDALMEEEYNELPPSLSPQPASAEVGPDNDYCCSLCSKMFVNKGNKKRHERRVHGLQNASGATVPLTNGASSSTDEDALSTPPNNPDQQKIQFAAGLKLLQKNSTPISCEALSKIELSYAEKCKAMVTMHQSLTCACHNVAHQNLKGLLSHLRALRIWFPVFTCYNCMITFTDRSTFTRHIVRCPSQSLDTITKLSNLRKRSEVKTRLYQNFKCTTCRFMYSFHDTFCKHVDEEHGSPELPARCRCGRTFDDVDDYRDHVYVSCLVEYYCDICFVTTNTLEEFQRHAADVHDRSEGFVLLQDDNYKIRKPSMHGGAKEEAEAAPKEEPESAKLLPNPASDQRKCPVCGKEYSSYKNMMRHYKVHSGEVEVKGGDGAGEEAGAAEESLYSCPDCGGMYNTEEWRRHLEELHEVKTCSECGKCFQFSTEFEQHRSAHLNIKVYRDSKTQAYRSTMISPGCEEGGDEPQPEDNMEVDKPKTFPCDVCQRDFATYSGLWEHTKRAHPEKKTPSGNAYPRRCPECDKVCTTGAAFYRHKLVHERDVVPADASCNKGPRARRSAAGPEEESYHTCKKCFKVFSSRYNLKCHMKCHGINLSPSPSARSRSPRKPCCDVCQRVFNTAAEVARHKEADHPDPSEMPTLDTQPPEAVFTCDVCVATCATRAALKKHKEAHAQEAVKRPGHVCDLCRKTFATASALSTHVGWHKRDPNSGSVKIMRSQKGAAAADADVVKHEFQCATCLAAMPNDTALQVHILEKHRSVSAIMLVPRCHVCDKDFASQDEYETHKRLHDFLERQKQHEQSLLQQQPPNGEPKPAKSYPCKYCSAGFSRSDTLGAHVRHHHKEHVATEFKCHQCERVFDKQNSLSIHLKVHEKQRTPTAVAHARPLFSCSICSMGFNLPKDLRAHTITAHPF